MKKLTHAVAASVILAFPVMSLACDYPERPTLPDGETAAKEEMIAAQKAVKSFLAEIDSYLDCIDQEDKAASAALESEDEEAKKRREELISKKFDAANEAKFLLGEQWNQQVRAYNARKSAEKSE